MRYSEVRQPYHPQRCAQLRCTHRIKPDQCANKAGAGLEVGAKYEVPPIEPTRMHGVSAHANCDYLSALFSMLNPILSLTNLSRLECAETQCAWKPRAYESSSASTGSTPTPKFQCFLLLASCCSLLHFPYSSLLCPT